MIMIDIGANLTHDYFKSRVGQVIDEAAQEGVEHIIVTGSDYQSALEALNLCEQYPQLSFTAGIHPHNALATSHPDLKALTTLWQHPRCVAIGECGLDYNREYQEKTRQRECFAAQLDLASCSSLPLFLHLRDADLDFIELLKNHAGERAKVVHCYTDGVDVLRQLLDDGAMIGITGWLCDQRRNQPLLESLQYLPIDRVMIESDAPWLLPRTIENFRRIRHNHPRYLGYVLTELARLKGIEIDVLAQQLRTNTSKFFKLEGRLGAPGAEQ